MYATVYTLWNSPQVTPETMQDRYDDTASLYYAVDVNNVEIVRGTWKMVFDFCMKWGYTQFSFWGPE